MTQELTCTSCKRRVSNTEGTATFNCPACKAGIIRCGNCRSIAAQYKCVCGFVGPN